MEYVTLSRPDRLGLMALVFGVLLCIALPSWAAAPLGQTVCWGSGISNTGVYPQYGQSQAPALTNVVAVAAGDYHTVLLKSDGTVTAFGAAASTPGVYPCLG